jgi:spore coat polysaccharide biosynthesis protein SpsF
MKVVAIIQARMSSTRLPGKVLKTAGGRTMLERMLERVKRAQTVDQVVVATTTDPSDDAIVRASRKYGAQVFRGSLPDVLDRYYQAAKQYQADIVVRLTGDCPLIDPDLIDEVVNALIDKQVDFACNRLPPPFSRTYPIGLDVEACTFAALENAWRNADQKHEREHVLPFLYAEPGRFKVFQLNHAEDLGHLRWTLDTPEDLQLLRRIYRNFKGRNDFSWLDVLALWRAKPEIFAINAQVKHKSYLESEARQKGAKA